MKAFLRHLYWPFYLAGLAAGVMALTGTDTEIYEYLANLLGTAGNGLELLVRILSAVFTKKL